MGEEKRVPKDEQLDEFCQRSLEGFHAEPAAKVWEGINRKLLFREILRLNFSNIPGYFRVALSAIILMTGATLLVVSGDDIPVILPEQDLIPGTPVIATGTISQSTDQPPNAPLKAKVTSSVSNNPERTTQKTITERTGSSEKTTPDQVSIFTTTTNPEVEMSQVTTPVFPTGIETGTNLPVTISARIPDDFFSLTISPEIRKDLPATISPSLPKEPGAELISNLSVRTPLPQAMEFGLNVTPDMVFYKDVSNYYKYNYTFDLGVQYSLGRFYIQGGLGLTYSSDIGNYAISYLKNDSVGYFLDVTSYGIDPAHPGEPVFNTKIITVFDSVQYLNDYGTKNRYQYLQVPLSFGYLIVNKDKWKIGIDAGILYSYLAGIDEPDPDFYSSDSRLLGMERTNSRRNRNSFGLTGAIKLDYYFTEKFHLMIEPTFKYYLNAIEENSQTGVKQPFSIGLRAGIWYHLDLKTRKK